MATKIADAYIEIRTNQAKFGKELKTMETSVKRSTDRMNKNFSRIGKGVSDISRVARYGFLAITAAIAGTVYAAAKFEKQMANVSTMLSRKAMPIMKKYKDQIGKMAIVFGESTDTLSKGLYDILSASIAPEKALSVLAVSAKAAAAGMTDTGVAADAITTIINSYGYAAEDAAMVSDKLFTIIKQGKTTFAELGPNIGKVAATASMAGLSFDELGATIATVTKAGVRTEMTMTAINGILKVFIKPADDARKAAKEFGLELSTNTLKTIGLVGVLEKLNGATAEQLALIFPEIEGLKGVAAALGDLTGHTEVYKAMLDSVGATQEAYLKQTNTLTFSFNQLREAGKYLAVQVGEIFTPAVSKAINKIRDYVIKLGQAINELTSDQKKSIAQMVLFGAAVLGVIGGLGLIGTVAKLFVSAGLVIMGSLGLLLSPIGLLIAGVLALVAAWALGWDEIKKITSKLVEVVVMPVIKFGSKKLDNIADWIRVEKLGMEADANEEFDKSDIVVIAKFLANLVWEGMKHLNDTIENLGEWIRKEMGLPEGKTIWELTSSIAVMGLALKLIWEGVVNVTGTIRDWIISESALDKPLELIAKVEKMVLAMPEWAKWAIDWAGDIFLAAYLGSKIASRITAIKIAPMRLAINIILVWEAFNIGKRIGEWLNKEFPGMATAMKEFFTEQFEKHPELIAPDVSAFEAFWRLIGTLIKDALLAYFSIDGKSIGQYIIDEIFEGIGDIKMPKLDLGKLAFWRKDEIEVTKTTKKLTLLGKSIELIGKELENMRDKWHKDLGQPAQKAAGDVAASFILLKHDITAIASDTPLEFRKKFIQGFLRATPKMQQAILNAVTSGKLKQAMTMAGVELADAFRGKSPGFITGLEEATKETETELNKMIGLVGGLSGKMKSAVKPVMDVFTNMFTGMIDMMIASENKAISEMGKTIKAFVDNMSKDFEGLFIDFGEGTEGMPDDLEESIEEMKGIWKRFVGFLKGNWTSLVATLKDAWTDFTSSLVDYAADIIQAFADIISGIKSFGEALMGLIKSIPVIGGIVTAVVSLGKAIWDWVTGMGAVKRAIEESFKDIAAMFEEIGASMHDTIEAAEADIARLIASTADIETSTREKLIKELDQYYDYRNLKEMELAELMELAEETKRRIQEEGLEAVLQGIESEEEAQARKNDQAVEGLDAITEAYNRELEMIARKIILFKIEILLLRAKGEAEWGNQRAAKKYREEAQKMMEDLQAEIEATTAALEKETKAHKEGGEQTKKSEKEKQDAIEETKKAVEDLGKTTVESMDKTAEEMVDAIESMARAIVIAIQGMSKKIVDAINSMVNEINTKLREIPDRIDFDIVGNLHMPEIPDVSPQWFNITGRYKAPEIPSYQHGTPYIPRTQVAVLHKGEAVIPAGQNRAGAGGGNTFNIRILHTGDIRSDVDEEQFMKKVTDRITETVRRT